MIFWKNHFMFILIKISHDTISIKYSNTVDIKKTIKKLINRLYKTKKYFHINVYQQVGILLFKVNNGSNVKT